MIDKIIFDYDSDKLSGRKMLKDGIKNILFSISKFLGIRINYFNDYYNMSDNYALRIIKLNKMLGIKTIIGVKNTMDKNELISKLKLLDSDIDIRVHIHINERPNPNRDRLWIPSLNQSKLSWNFETEYCENGKPILKSTDLPIFHFDYPHHIYNYIDFLYNRNINYDNDYDVVGN